MMKARRTYARFHCSSDVRYVVSSVLRDLIVLSSCPCVMRRGRSDKMCSQESYSSGSLVIGGEDDRNPRVGDMSNSCRFIWSSGIISFLDDPIFTQNCGSTADLERRVETVESVEIVETLADSCSKLTPCDM